MVSLYRRPKIGVFDSGLGGLGVVKQLLSSSLACDLIYLGDTARLPYGTKSKDAIKQYACDNVSFLISQDVDIVVIACHTVSAFALDFLKQTFSIPFVSMVPLACEKALQVTTSKEIGVVGTLATIASTAYETFMFSYAKDIHIKTKACSLLVSLVEEGWVDSSITFAIIDEYLGSFLTNTMDTLILACTHFPLLEGVIRDFVGDGVVLVDPAKEVPACLFRLCRQQDIYRKGVTRFLGMYVTDFVQHFREVSQIFLGQNINIEVEKVNLARSLCIPT